MATKSEITTIALFEHAAGLSAAVKGMESFLPFYLKTLPAPERALINRYRKAKEEARAQLEEWAAADLAEHGIDAATAPPPDLSDWFEVAPRTPDSSADH